MKSLEQPMRMKNNGQISIVLNAKKRNPLTKEAPDSQLLQKDIPPEHTALKEIEKELGTLGWHGRNEKNDKRNLCLDLY